MLTARTTLAQQVLPRAGLARDGFLIIAGTLLMAACAQIAIPLPWTPVPFTLQTFGVLLIGALYGPRLGALTMLAYLLEGVAGLPVFAGGRTAWTQSSLPGLPVIIGPTAGYLLSYPFVAALVGALALRGWDRKLPSAMLAMLLGNVVILLAGFSWFAVEMSMLAGKTDLVALLMGSVLPFLPGDAIKVLLAALALPGGWALFGKRG